MLVIQNMGFTHPNKELLFQNINLTVNASEKIALIGNNGVGKSTLLKLIAGERQYSLGSIHSVTKLLYIPQHFGQYNDLTIAQALKIDDKLRAFRAILNGEATEQNYDCLQDDWSIEDRYTQAMDYWQLAGLKWSQKMRTLSGGQKTKVFLAGMNIHEPELALLDEPSNHLDGASRELLYNYIASSKAAMMVVSHDRTLLNLLPKVCELSSSGLTTYGGNYEFYAEQKDIASNAFRMEMLNKEKDLRKAKEKERVTKERQQRLDNRGRAKQEKAGVARIMMNTLRNKAEISTSKLKSVHGEKIDGIRQDLQDLRASAPAIDQMKFGFDHSALHRGKMLFTATGINYGYGSTLLWQQNQSFEIVTGERIALKGINGSGKTTFIRLLLGELEPSLGSVFRAATKTIYIDQDYSLINNSLNVYEQALQFNQSGLQDHEVRIRLSRFLFGKDDWDKSCDTLSGGERMRLVLCCLNIARQSPDLIVLDEPTNNLDIHNIEILATAIREYQGTLIVVSHDEQFLEETAVERFIWL